MKQEAPTRTRLVGAAATPAIVAVVLGLWLLAQGLTGHIALFYSVPVPPSSLMDAVTRKDLAEAHAAIYGGANPNALAPYRHADITLGRTMNVSPLFVAVAQGDENMVRMLLGQGVDPTTPSSLAAVCAGAMMGRDDLIALLADAGAETEAVTTCHEYHDESPATLAERSGHAQTAKILLDPQMLLAVRLRLASGRRRS